MNLMRGIDLKKIAGKMNGASGAELKVLFPSQLILLLSPLLVCVPVVWCSDHFLI